jgi:hypothetical protein
MREFFHHLSKHKETHSSFVVNLVYYFDESRQKTGMWLLYNRLCFVIWIGFLD